MGLALRGAALVALAALGASVWSAAAAQARLPIDPDQAAAAFKEAAIVCARDSGKTWSHSLCGPIMLIDPPSRLVVANQADAEGALKPAGSVFVGRLPEAVIISNTPTQWSGTYWTQVIWPLPDDTATRQVMFAHELFHRIQRDLDGPKIGDGDNGHLDTLEGRYWLQLEWRALAKALTAKTAAQRRTAESDALVFRAERYRRFPGAAKEEQALELNEGVAEYTGVHVGLQTPDARNAYAVHDLQLHVADDSFVRAFAYATGPAYGLLLDRADPAWRSALKSGERLDQLLQNALKISLPANLETSAAKRAAAYDDGALRAHEVARDTERRKRLAAFKATLVDGPVLTLPLAHSNRQFRPTTLVPLDDLGVVYPTMRLTDAWGSLEVEGGSGALLFKDMRRATVSLAGAEAGGLKGDGWTLRLNPGWSIKPGPRAGDLAVSPDR